MTEHICEVCIYYVPRVLIKELAAIAVIMLHFVKYQNIMCLYCKGKTLDLFVYLHECIYPLGTHEEKSQREPRNNSTATKKYTPKVASSSSKTNEFSVRNKR